MRKSITFFLAFLIASGSVFAQTDSLNLMQCLKAARNNATLKPQMDILNNISDLKLSNINSSNLPGLNAFGKATYQSETVTVPGPTGIEVDPFQYNFGLEATQKIFDGGMAGKSKEVERAANAAENRKVEMDLYQLNNEITRLFFTYKLLLESKNVLQLKNDVLQKRAKELKSGIRNGLVSQNQLDKINAEILLTDQQILEIESKCLQTVNAIGMLTGLEMSSTPNFYISDTMLGFGTATRPELSYFDAEKNRLQKMSELKTRQNLPKVYAFGQAGYSYPSLNMFANEANYYYIVGAKLSWTIYDWNQVKHEKQVMQLQQQIIETKKSDFNRNMSIQLENEQLEQEKLLSVMEIDKQLITQRESITKGSETSLNNGVITSTAYLEELNAEIKAKIDLETHKLQYLNSIVKTALLNGIQIQ